MSKRGPYKRYLLDSSLPKPFTTEWSQMHKKRGREDPTALNENEQQTAAQVTEMIVCDLTEDVNESINIPDGDFIADLLNLPDDHNFDLRENDFSEYVNDNNEEVYNNDLMDENEHDQENLNNMGHFQDMEYEGDRNEVLINNECINNEDVLEPEERNEERKLLYDGCPLTLEESDLLIMSHCIRHKSNDTELQDIINLVNAHLPQPSNSSRYMFLKKFPNIVPIQEYYFCPKCFISLNFEGRNLSSNCFKCKETFQKKNLKRDGHYFVYISLKNQLENLLKDENLYSNLIRINTEDGFISDVVSGSVHSYFRSKKIFNNSDISLQFNIDGVSPFKSSKVSLCPIQVSINELPYKIRKENILLCALWYGKSKPVMDLYLQPFVKELREMHEVGINILSTSSNATFNMKVHTFLSPVDSVARCVLQNMHQYNGEYGCPFCYHPGLRVPVGKGHARVYCGGKGELRTEEKYQEDVNLASQKPESETVNGIYGETILNWVPLLSIIKSFPPDYLHAVLLGVVKSFLLAWFNSINKNESWYLGSKRDIFNERILKILPTTEITRIPRNIKDIKLFKGSELKNFLLYYSLPCLKNLFINEKYYKHWSLLVYSMHIFLSEKINADKFNLGKKALEKFVHETEIFYNEKMMKYNIHLLLHIPESVQRFGLLWAWSTFPYESYNYNLRNMIFSSQSVLSQVCKAYLRLGAIKEKKVFEKPNCSLIGKKLYNNYMDKYRRSEKCIYYGKLRLLGTAKHYYLNTVEKCVISDLLQEDVKNDVSSYDRFIYKNILLHTTRYSRLYTRNNSVVETLENEFISIINLVKITSDSINNNVQKYVILGEKLEPVTNERLCYYDGVSSDKYSVICKITENIVAVYPNAIKKKCIVIPSYEDEEDIVCVIPLVNTFETD